MYATVQMRNGPVPGPVPGHFRDPFWVTFGSRSGPNLVQIWSKTGPDLAPIWSRFGPNLVQIWSQSGPNLVQIWSQSGPDLVPIWSQSGPSLVRNWSQSGPDLVPIWSRSARAGRAAISIPTHVFYENHGIPENRVGYIHSKWKDFRDFQKFHFLEIRAPASGSRPARRNLSPDQWPQK